MPTELAARFFCSTCCAGFENARLSSSRSHCAVRGGGWFEELGPTHVLVDPPDEAAGLRGRVGRWWLDRRSAQRRQRTLQSLLDSGGFDLLYLNTITLGDQLAALRRLTVPVITHVHELSWAIQRYARGEERRVLNASARVVCVSEAVRSNLVNRFGCPAREGTLSPRFCACAG